MNFAKEKETGKKKEFDSNRLGLIIRKKKY